MESNPGWKHPAGHHPLLGARDGGRLPRVRDRGWSLSGMLPQSRMGRRAPQRVETRAWGVPRPLPLRCRLPRRSPKHGPEPAQVGADGGRDLQRRVEAQAHPGRAGRRRLRTMTKTKTRRTTRRLLGGGPLPLEPGPLLPAAAAAAATQPGGGGAGPPPPTGGPGGKQQGRDALPRGAP